MVMGTYLDAWVFLMGLKPCANADGKSNSNDKNGIVG
jgi:hypothetical protein